MHRRWRPWRQAWEDALYGPDGFFRREAPRNHFRTAATSPPFAAAVRALAGRVDVALGCPDPFDLVDVGAGRGELLQALPDVPSRWRLTAVELAADPHLRGVRWSASVPAAVGVLLANEWLDAVPLEVVEDGRTVLVADDGTERLGDRAAPHLLRWAARWWPGAGRVEVGASRDVAWAAAVARLERGVAVAVDYGHVHAPHAAAACGDGDGRARRATLTGYRAGRQVRPVPDGSCDLTAHVAVDAVAAATGSRVLDQRAALRALGVDAAVPRWEGDGERYARALQQSSQAAVLLDPAGPGGFSWLVRAVGVADPLRAAGPR